MGGEIMECLKCGAGTWHINGECQRCALRVLVCGGRNFEDRAMLFRVLDSLHDQTPFGVVIHGMARGADRLADHWALYNHIPVYRFHALWLKQGNAAGPIRNQRMLDKGRPDCVIAFPGGNGTKDMIRKAIGAGLPVYKVKADGSIDHALTGRCGVGNHPAQADTQEPL
jgi:hypothetical protein